LCNIMSHCRIFLYFFFSSRRRHTSFSRDWSSDVCSSDLTPRGFAFAERCEIDKVHTRHILIRYVGAERSTEETKRSKDAAKAREIGRASCRERLWMAVLIDCYKNVN